MGEQLTKSEIGIKCNPYDNSFSEDLFKYYNSISWPDFIRNCDREIDGILISYNKGQLALRNIVKDK